MLYLLSRHAPSAIFPAVHERNRCFNWLIVVALLLKMHFQPLRFSCQYKAHELQFVQASAEIESHSEVDI